MVNIRQKIIDFKSKNEHLSNSEIARQLGCSRMSVIRALAPMLHVTVTPVTHATVTPAEPVTVAGNEYHVPEPSDEDASAEDNAVERLEDAIEAVDEAACFFGTSRSRSHLEVVGWLRQRLEFARAGIS